VADLTGPGTATTRPPARPSPHGPEIARAEENGEDGLADALRTLGRPGVIPVTVHLLEPFDPAAIGDRKAMSAEARRRVADAIKAAGSPMRVE
jgi:1-acyl-sn-glycerol-3-phosphate acyltransferase